MKMYDKSQTIINNKMDMINYLKFFEEHVNIKCLLFNDIQSLCLNFTKKQKLYEKNSFNKNINPDYENINEIVDYYVKNPILSKIDKDILELLPEKMQDFISKTK